MSQTDQMVETLEDDSAAIKAYEPVKKKEDNGNKRTFWQEEKRRLKKHRSIIWFVIPAMILAFIFGYIPLAGITIAFRSSFNIYGGRTIWEAFQSGTWTMSNFALILSEPNVLLALRNTLIINFFSLLIAFPLPIIFAFLLADINKPALSKLVLIILCLPQFFSWAVVVGMWMNLLSPDDGFVNNVLVQAGLLDTSFYFFGSNAWFKPLVIFLKIWKGTGWSSIIYYAAMVSIDKNLYEVATIEGANKFQKIRYVTLPSILPTIAIQLILTLTYIMSVGFEQLYTMYTPGTRYDQYVLDTYLYDISIQNRTNAPFATVLGLINGLIALFLMLGGNAIVKKTTHTSLW